MTQRFYRSDRLLETRVFQQVFERPIRSSDALFTVLGRSRSDGGDVPRLGLAISRKSARRAVDRNRIKRLARESFRRERAGLCPIDIVVTCRRDAVMADNATLLRSLASHWGRLRDRLCASSST